MVVVSNAKQGSSNNKKERRWHLFQNAAAFSIGLLVSLARSQQQQIRGASSASVRKHSQKKGPAKQSDCNCHNTASDNRTDFSLALDQSFGLLDDIPSATWHRMKKRFAEQENFYTFRNKGKNVMDTADRPHMWYQLNFEPNFACQNEVRVGGMGDGPKWVCNPRGIKRQAEQRREKSPGHGCLIYSIGSSGNFIFEGGMIKEVGNCEIHIFDFIDFTGQMPNEIKENAHFHKWGLKPSQGTWARPKIAKDSDEFLSLQEIVAKLGHKGRTIDIFKIDCEGCEWTTYVDWINTDVSISQILTELHDVPENAIDFFVSLQKEGYVTFHKEPNTMGCGGKCIEYAFLRLHTDFFSEYGFPPAYYSSKPLTPTVVNVEQSIEESGKPFSGKLGH